jgi:predicted Rossmann fold nucleotide-binding protein DprA/Smf involved in DNA uptake
MSLTQHAKDLVYSCITDQAMPIFKIAAKAQISVQTTSKYCYILQAEGKVHMEKFGNMQLVRRNEK